jgi:hypothetical protein
MTTEHKPTKSQEGRLRIQLAFAELLLLVASIALLQGERPDWFWWPLTTDWWWMGNAILCGIGGVLGVIVWLGYVFGAYEEPQRGF